MPDIYSTNTKVSKQERERERRERGVMALTPKVFTKYILT
jgi:hypothetical protein